MLYKFNFNQIALNSNDTFIRVHKLSTNICSHHLTIQAMKHLLPHSILVYDYLKHQKFI